MAQGHKQTMSHEPISDSKGSMGEKEYDKFVLEREASERKFTPH
jgi:hypothetical protein